MSKPTESIEVLLETNFDLSLFFILLTIVGGSLISASSGFKYTRIYILLKISYQEIYRLVKPINIIDKNLSKSYRKRSSNKQITKLAEYEDCKVYSRSAPSERNNLYLENYININSKKHKEPGYKIIGSPPIKNYNSNLLGYLHKSVKTIKNLFKINI